MHFKQKFGFLFLIGFLLLAGPLTEEVEATPGGSGVEGEEADELVDKNLELPTIYENTIFYNGTVNPDLSLNMEHPGGGGIPYVNDDGQFSLNLAGEDFEAGDELKFSFDSEDFSIMKVRTVEVQPAEEGMEVVESSADTSTVEERILEETTIDWREESGRYFVDIDTVGDKEGPLFYGYEGNPVDEDKQLENIKDYTYQARLGEYQEQDPDSWQPGDTIQVYIVALGVTAVKEIDVPNDLEGSVAEDQENNSESSDDGSETESTENNQNESDTENNEANEEETESDVSNANENSGVMSPIGWTIIGILIVAIIIGGIIWGKKRKKSKE